MAGRFAPSPTGELHLGNLRTALLAWLAARSTGLRFIVRIEDLDRVTSSPAHESCQLADLAAIGLDWDGPVVRQSERFDLYRDAIATLDRHDLVYPCYCTRREIRAQIDQAAQAPNGPPAAYPGTCRELSRARVAELEADGRRPALRLRTDGASIVIDDALAGSFVGAVDDVVLARADGVPAYNLAVVVDDAAQGVTQVVRGDDLLPSTPRQVLLQQLLGLPTPRYAHVPLVVNHAGVRLAKRDGAVTLADLARQGVEVADVVAALAATITPAALAATITPAAPSVRVDVGDLVAGFVVEQVPRALVALDDLQRSWS